MIDAKKSFYGEDGLLYCAVCGEALEAFYPQNSIMKGGKHPRQCACERKVREEEEKYRKEKVCGLFTVGTSGNREKLHCRLYRKCFVGARSNGQDDEF